LPADINKGWDGYYKGLSATMSTYIWMISYTDENNNKQAQQGTVTLIK